MDFKRFGTKLKFIYTVYMNEFVFLFFAEYRTAQLIKLRIKSSPTSPKANSMKLWSAMPSCAKKRK